MQAYGQHLFFSDPRITYSKHVHPVNGLERDKVTTIIALRVDRIFTVSIVRHIYSSSPGHTHAMTRSLSGKLCATKWTHASDSISRVSSASRPLHSFVASASLPASDGALRAHLTNDAASQNTKGGPL